LFLTIVHHYFFGTFFKMVLNMCMKMLLVLLINAIRYHHTMRKCNIDLSKEAFKYTKSKETADIHLVRYNLETISLLYVYYREAE